MGGGAVAEEFPSQNVYYQEIDGQPSVLTPAHINLGIAIDIAKPGGDRALVVPAIKRAEAMSFGEFVAAYEELVSKARANHLTADDFGRATISLTNPGGIRDGALRSPADARPGFDHRLSGHWTSG